MYWMSRLGMDSGLLRVDFMNEFYLKIFMLSLIKYNYVE
jgi:hypothetical protein